MSLLFIECSYFLMYFDTASIEIEFIELVVELLFELPNSSVSVMG